ncbi:MAG TPA: hypothetical protein PKH23_01385 [Bacillota bacterium]|nr:hypothetical protein [Bacillota bacterium]
MKKILLIIMAVLLIAGLAACGPSKEEKALLGKYILTDHMYRDASRGELQEAYIELKAGGKGSSNRDNLDLDIEWTLEGEKLTLKEKFLGIELDFEGSLKDGVLMLEDPGFSVRVYTKEGQDPVKAPDDYFKK